ncbi:MAG: chemotaxis protein CheW [Rhodocyclaceae bacterium]|nr:chemotaxis protein CheW [Rhodocyclaceae bacterium]
MTQALLVRAGGRKYAIPSVMVEQVMELKEAAIEKIRSEVRRNGWAIAFLIISCRACWGDAQAVPEQQRRYSLLLLRAGSQRVSVQVDELCGNQEMVVKNIGPQLARVIGIAGATVLGDGEVVLILNPIALASREIRASAREAIVSAVPRGGGRAGDALADGNGRRSDSLTVRKIAGRLLSREGYHVITAKDGVDTLEQLLDVVPDVMLVDIEMPRMDGFDLTAQRARRCTPEGRADHHDYIAHGGQASQLRKGNRRQSLPRQALSGRRVAWPYRRLYPPGDLHYCVTFPAWTPAVVRITMLAWPIKTSISRTIS